jgi:hypothetical protein
MVLASPPILSTSQGPGRLTGPWTAHPSSGSRWKPNEGHTGQ